MVSFIIVAKEKNKRKAYVDEYAKNLQINHFDITIIEKDLNSKQATQSIGIEIIKLLQAKIFLKPIKSANKMVILEDAQLLTPEAQNALLKVLEEPPANTYIILGTEAKSTLLPTILSRCQIIQLEEENKKISEETQEELHAFIQKFPGFPIGSRLKYAEQISKDKEKAITWIEDLILILREKILKKYSDETLTTTDSYAISQTDTIRKFQSLLTLLKTTNINPRFAIEHTLLSL
jgi:DNA polymerase III delta prime subunit